MSPLRPFVLALLGILILSSCRTDCTSECQQRYNDGYSAGNRAGYQTGYNAGYQAGERSGYRDGFQAGEQTGLRSGNEEGHRRGYREGYSEGERVGFRRGYLSGARFFIGESIIPTLAGAAIVSILTVTFIVFRRILIKIAANFLKRLAAATRSALLFFQLRKRVSSLGNLQKTRASIIARTAVLDLYLRTQDIICSAECETEFSFIATRVEVYLAELSAAGRRSTDSEVSQLAKQIVLSPGLTLSEREKLLYVINATLLSNITHQTNLVSHENKSLEKVTTLCYNFINKRRRDRIMRKLKRAAIFASVSVNFLVFCALLIYLYDTDLLHQFSSRFYFVATTLLP